MELDEFEPLATPTQLADHTQGKIRAADPRADGLLRGASVGVRRYCGWHITPVIEGDRHVLDGPGGPVLALPTGRLVSVDALTDDGHQVQVDQLTVEVSRRGLLRYRDGRRWSHRYGSIDVTITHGHTSAPDVVAIVLQAAALALSSPMGVTREQAGALAVSWATTAPGVSGGLTLLERDLALLAPYRIGGMS